MYSIIVVSDSHYLLSTDNQGWMIEGKNIALKICLDLFANGLLSLKELNKIN